MRRMTLVVLLVAVLVGSPAGARHGRRGVATAATAVVDASASFHRISVIRARGLRGYARRLGREVGSPELHASTLLGAAARRGGRDERGGEIAFVSSRSSLD